MGGGSFFWFAETDFIKNFSNKVAKQLSRDKE